MFRPLIDDCIDCIIFIAAGYALVEIFHYSVTEQWSVVGAANQSFLLVAIMQALFSLTAGIRFDKILVQEAIQSPFISTRNLRIFRCSLYMFCILLKSNLKSGILAPRYRKKVGTINFPKYATLSDKVISFFYVFFTWLFIILFLFWGLIENPGFSYEHGKSYYMDKWWQETKAPF